MNTHILRGLLVIVWGTLSTVMYAMVVFTVGMFSKKAGQYIARLWCSNILTVAGVRIKTTGLDKIKKGGRYVFACNHQSGIDIPSLYGGLPFMLSFIAKKELFFIPFFGWGMALVGHIWIDRGNARKAYKSIKRAIAKLSKENISLVIFPEGTRSVDGALGEFKKGGFALAIESGVCIVPVALRGTRLALPKMSVFVRPAIVHLDIGDPIDVKEFKGDKAKLAEVTRERISQLLGLS